jgi:cell shape-determining protein MreC
MSDAVLIALFVALPLILAQVAALVVGIRTSRRAATIETHVNSTASEARAEIRALREQVDSLVEQNAEKRQTAALLAQKAATVVEVKGV